VSRALRFAPLAILLALLAGMVWRIATPANTDVPSRLEGQKVPEFALQPALYSKAGLAASDLAGGTPHLVNFFASWCVPCIGEVKVLEQLKAKGAAIDGIAVRDRPEQLAQFLARNGDPYQRIGADPQSQVQIALGSSGVPESFIVDGNGIVRHQYIGPLEPSDVADVMMRLDAVR
jgi:cytochrome c biogenesis protein CcmG/thiol:disulfide interchange protein DsbE